MNILKALTRSALGLDLYVWLNYRVFGLERPFRLTWLQLYRQFGISPANATDKNIVQDFRTQALRELKKIKAAWPGLDYATPAGVLELRPSEPSVAARQLLLLSGQPRARSPARIPGDRAIRTLGARWTRLFRSCPSSCVFHTLLLLRESRCHKPLTRIQVVRRSSGPCGPCEKRRNETF